MPPRHPQTRDPSSEPVNRIVLHALSAIAPGLHLVPPRPPLTHFLDRLEEAALAPRPGALGPLCQQMEEVGIGRSAILMAYLPRVARRLGQGWVEDRLDFGQVSIGAARLQSLVHRLDTGACGGARGRLILGVPEGEQHTLGATILAASLRQQGYSICLDLALTVPRLTAELGRQDCDGVFLSISGEGHLDHLHHLVACSRYESWETPIVIGGPMIDQMNDIQARSGADLATSDVDTALRFCERARAERVEALHMGLPKVGE